MSVPHAVETLCFDYWTDPLCIWAYVAREKFEAMQRTSQLDLLPLHRIVCVFGDIGERFATGSWSEDGPKGRAAKTADVARRFGKNEVTGQVWVDDAPASSWAPAAAIKAVFAAERAGRLTKGAGDRYQWEMRRAFFEHNRNTARRAVQLEVAEQCEFDRAEIERRLDDGSALAAVWHDQDKRVKLGVRGSPTYVFDGAREMLYGNVPLELIEATVACLNRDGAPGRSPC